MRLWVWYLSFKKRFDILIFRFDGLQKDEQQLLLALYDPHQPEVRNAIVTVILMIVLVNYQSGVMVMSMKITMFLNDNGGQWPSDDDDNYYSILGARGERGET